MDYKIKEFIIPAIIISFIIIVVIILVYIFHDKIFKYKEGMSTNNINPYNKTLNLYLQFNKKTNSWEPKIQPRPPNYSKIVTKMDYGKWQISPGYTYQEGPWYSSNFLYKLIMQLDGNLVLYKYDILNDKELEPVWSSNTFGSQYAFNITFDGILVINDVNGVLVKSFGSTKTKASNNNFYLEIMDNGKLAIKKNATVLEILK